VAAHPAAAVAVVRWGEQALDTAPIAASFVSAVSLFHPDGVPATTLVWGNSRAAGGGGDQPRPGPAEVIVLLTHAAGQDSPSPLGPLVENLASAMTPDGVGYVLARPSARPRLRQLLRRYDLIVTEERLHLPIWNAGLALVPLATGPLRYALANLLPKLSLRAHLAALAGRQVGGARLLARLLPEGGLVVRRAGARPLFDWLLRLRPELEPSSAVVVRTSWRQAEGVTVLYGIPDGHASPSAVVKVGMAKQDLGSELRRLAELAPQARRSGAAVPHPLGVTQWRDRQVLLQTAVPGKVAATLLITYPGQFQSVLERVVAWLEQWNQETRIVQLLTGQRLRDELLIPAASLAPELEGGPAYVAWLASRCAAVEGRQAPLVATHNDLTMWNVLLDGRDGLGVVDWESGCLAGLPLTDLLYTVVDGVAATEKYRDRLTAFQACFAPGGAQAARMARWQQHLCRALDLPADVAQLCWHATWLHHAANEQAPAGAARPFLQIVQWLVLQPQFRDAAGDSTESRAAGARPALGQ
jgi:thiamine kinase-like enzyme